VTMFPHTCPLEHRDECAICFWLAGHRWGNQVRRKPWTVAKFTSEDGRKLSRIRQAADAGAVNTDASLTTIERGGADGS